MWHESEAVHTVRVPLHVPNWHESLLVQALPSLQACPGQLYREASPSAAGPAPP